MRPTSPTWTDEMARRITRRVRRAGRVSWLLAAATVLGAGGLVLAPRPVQGPDLVEIVGLASVQPAARVAPAAPERSPVQVKLTTDSDALEAPVEIRF